MALPLSLAIASGTAGGAVSGQQTPSERQALDIRSSLDGSSQRSYLVIPPQLPNGPRPHLVILHIEAALIEAGWRVQSRDAINLHAGHGVAVREFPLKKGHGYADYLLYVDGQALGVIEAKKEPDMPPFREGPITSS